MAGFASFLSMGHGVDDAVCEFLSCARCLNFRKFFSTGPHEQQELADKVDARGGIPTGETGTYQGVLKCHVVSSLHKATVLAGVVDTVPILDVRTLLKPAAADKHLGMSVHFCPQSVTTRPSRQT